MERYTAAAQAALRAAPLVALGDGKVRDLRFRDVPYLPAAAALEGLAYLTTARTLDGRLLIVIEAASPEQVRAFKSEWASILVDVYGVPERGFAGGYLRAAPTDR